MKYYAYVRILGEIDGKESGHKLRISPETLSQTGPLAAYVPDIAGGDVIVLRLSDIMADLSDEERRRNEPFIPAAHTGRFEDLPPPEIPEKKEESFTEMFFRKRDSFTSSAYAFMEMNKFQEEAIKSINIGFLHNALGTNSPTAYGMGMKGKEALFRIIMIPDQPGSEETRQNLIMGISGCKSFRLKDPGSFHTATLGNFVLLHEAGHFSNRTTSGIVNEALADEVADRTLRKIAASGEGNVHLGTLDTIRDLRALSALYRLHPAGLEENRDHAHSTGLLAAQPPSEILKEEESSRHLDTLRHLNGFIASLIGGALRPAADALVRGQGDPEQLEHYRENWTLPVTGETADLYSFPDDLVQSPDLYLSAAPALVGLKTGMFREDAAHSGVYDPGNMRLGHAFVQENPGMHYAFIRGIYDAGLFDGDRPPGTDEALQKRYVERYLQAYERIGDITQEERAVAASLAKEMKDAAIRLEDILPGTAGGPAHPPERKPPAPEEGPKTALPRP